MIRWPLVLIEHERYVCGPEDEFDVSCNGDPSSLTGEDDEAGFDDMPTETGWDDESDDDEEEEE